MSAESSTLATRIAHRQPRGRGLRSFEQHFQVHERVGRHPGLRSHERRRRSTMSCARRAQLRPRSRVATTPGAR
jgi:hypothetical protein